MTFAIVCPACRFNSRVPDRLRGKLVRCLKCEARFIVPDPGPVREDATDGKSPIRRPRGREATRNRSPSGSPSVRPLVILAVVSTAASLIVLFLLLNELSTPAVPRGGGWMSATFAEMGKNIMVFFWEVVLFATGAVAIGCWIWAAFLWTARRKRESLPRGSRLQPEEGKWTGNQSNTGTG